MWSGWGDLLSRNALLKKTNPQLFIRIITMFRSTHCLTLLVSINKHSRCSTTTIQHSPNNRMWERHWAKGFISFPQNGFASPLHWNMAGHSLQHWGQIPFPLLLFIIWRYSSNLEIISMYKCLDFSTIIYGQDWFQKEIKWIQLWQKLIIVVFDYWIMIEFPFVNNERQRVRWAFT